jgi:hypothetical protein
MRPKTKKDIHLSMMLFGSSKPEPTRISLQLPDQLVVVSRKKRRRASASSSRASAYTFDTDAEALTAVASLAGRVDEALRRIDADNHLRPVPVLREAVAPYLENGAAVAHDAALRAFFAPAAEEKGEDHVPTIALWALASIGRAYPERMLHICQRSDEEECALFTATTRRCTWRCTRSARRPFTRAASSYAAPASGSRRYSRSRAAATTCARGCTTRAEQLIVVE